MKLVALASFILIFAFITAQTASPAQTHEPQVCEEGELKGVVVDPNESRVAGALVIVENKRFRFETLTNDFGAFQLKVPAGKYELKIEGNLFRVYRKIVRVEVDKTETVNVKLWPMGTGGTLKIR